MKTHDKATAQRLIKQAKKVRRAVTRERAVTVLTVALTDAIWREGGEREDAIATCDIIHYALCNALHTRFDTHRSNVIPIRRKKSYMKMVRKSTRK